MYVKQVSPDAMGAAAAHLSRLAMTFVYIGLLQKFLGGTG